MVAIALTLNFGIAVFCLWVAWQLLRLRQKLRRITRALNTAQRKTDQVLCNAPQTILIGQTATIQFNKHLKGLGPSQQSLVRWFTIFTLIRSISGELSRVQSQSKGFRPSFLPTIFGRPFHSQPLHQRKR